MTVFKKTINSNSNCLFFKGCLPCQTVGGCVWCENLISPASDKFCAESCPTEFEPVEVSEGCDSCHTFHDGLFAFFRFVKLKN